MFRKGAARKRLARGWVANREGGKGGDHCFKLSESLFRHSCSTFAPPFCSRSSDSRRTTLAAPSVLEHRPARGLAGWSERRRLRFRRRTLAAVVFFVCESSSVRISRMFSWGRRPKSRSELRIFLCRFSNRKIEQIIHPGVGVTRQYFGRRSRNQFVICTCLSPFWTSVDHNRCATGPREANSRRP